MQARPHGFTLIEQLAVIALVGTASAGVLPALVAFHHEAEAAALASLAAAASSAMLLNQAGCLVTDQRPVPGKCQPVQDCQQVAGLLLNALPPGHLVPRQALPNDGGRCLLLRTRDGAAAAFHGAATGGG